MPTPRQSGGYDPLAVSPLIELHRALQKERACRLSRDAAIGIQLEDLRLIGDLRCYVNGPKTFHSYISTKSGRGAKIQIPSQSFLVEWYLTCCLVKVKIKADPPSSRSVQSSGGLSKGDQTFLSADSGAHCHHNDVFVDSISIRSNTLMTQKVVTLHSQKAIKTYKTMIIVDGNMV